MSSFFSSFPLLILFLLLLSIVLHFSLYVMVLKLGFKIKLKTYMIFAHYHCDLCLHTFRSGSGFCNINTATQVQQGLSEKTLRSKTVANTEDLHMHTCKVHRFIQDWMKIGVKSQCEFGGFWWESQTVPSCPPHPVGGKKKSVSLHFEYGRVLGSNLQHLSFRNWGWLCCFYF